MKYIHTFQNMQTIKEEYSQAVTKLISPKNKKEFFIKRNFSEKAFKTDTY